MYVFHTYKIIYSFDSKPKNVLHVVLSKLVNFKITKSLTLRHTNKSNLKC